MSGGAGGGDMSSVSRVLGRAVGTVQQAVASPGCGVRRSRQREWGGADSETPKRVKWGKEQLPRVAPVIPCVVVKRCIQGPHYLCRDHVVKGSGWQRKYFLFLMEHVKHTIGSEYVLIQPHSGTERHS